MAEAQLQQFLDKVRQLNAFVAMSEADSRLRQELRDCEHHDQVVALARRCGFEIGRRWGESPEQSSPTPAGSQTGVPELGSLRSAGVPAPDHGAGREAWIRAPMELELDVSLASWGVERLRPLLGGPCPRPGEEISEVLIETPRWRLQRIHSCAYQSPTGFWYDQPEDEWVVLLQGTAALRFDDQPAEQRLQAGDSLWIRAGRRHRVTATDPAPGTIWLALFWGPA